MAKHKSKSLVEAVGKLLRDITKLGHTPILVGGMAMALLDSNRVTKDFDFLINDEARKQKGLMTVLYQHGFELISKLDPKGVVVRTVDNPNLAHAKINIDPPKSAYFFNRDLDLRIDLLFDFPIPARSIVDRAQKRTVRSYPFYIADKQDLITMKEIAAKDRKNPADLQDLEFLKSLED